MKKILLLMGLLLPMLGGREKLYDQLVQRSPVAEWNQHEAGRIRVNGTIGQPDASGAMTGGQLFTEGQFLEHHFGGYANGGGAKFDHSSQWAEQREAVVAGAGGEYLCSPAKLRSKSVRFVGTERVYHQ